MTYDYVCSVCGLKVELDQSILDAHTPPVCECGSMMKRNWSSIQIRSDEFKSCSHYDTKAKKYVKSHGDHYDLGLGAWVNSKSERERLMKEKGLRPMNDAEQKPFASDGDMVSARKEAETKAFGL